jgi:FkbM family methyltransferase
MAGFEEMDYRRSEIGRKRSWYGLKRHVKKVLSLRLPHALLRGVVRFMPGLRQGGRLPAPASLREVEGRVAGTRFVMVRPDRCVVAKELYWGHGQRPRPEDHFAVELFARVAKRSDVMLDIGAYTGLFTLVGSMVNPDLTAHAFEIVPEVYQGLFDNCVRNDILHRVTLHHMGIGEDGALMRVPASSRDSALPSFYSSRLHFDTGVLVRFVSLDSFAKRLPAGSRVVVKVDVEGTENAVFRNGQRFLASFRPDILCEVLEGVGNGPELEKLLLPHGYRFYLVRERDLLPLDRIEPSPRFRDWFFSTLDAETISGEGIPIAPTN